MRVLSRARCAAFLLLDLSNVSSRANALKVN